MALEKRDSRKRSCSVFNSKLALFDVGGFARVKEGPYAGFGIYGDPGLAPSRCEPETRMGFMKTRYTGS